MEVNYPKLLIEIDYYLVAGRTESAAFLMWYLEKFYRLDKQDAVDSVCDNRGDKGVDGIYVNEAHGTIDIFQAKISQSENKSIGDTALKEFFGTLNQFDTEEKVQNLINSAGKAEVAALVQRLDLINKIGSYPVRGIFIANIDLSTDGKVFINQTEEMSYVGKSKLEAEYISDTKEVSKQAEAKFDVSTTEVTTYTVDTTTKTYIVPIKAKELVQLEGIENQSIFDYNVRGSLGNTKINKGIVRSIRDKKLHKKFPLFHNGITIVASEVEKTDDNITLNNFYVVNGCQSLTALYRNQVHLTDDLFVLTKIIKVPINTALSSQITEFSNRQNGVKSRDFKSFDPIQVRLQNEIEQRFKDQYFYEIQRGELNTSNGETVSNEDIGIYLMSFDLKEPWNTHRKYQVFEDAYNDLFARPEVTSERIVFLYILNQVISEKMSDLDNQMIARYSLTKYAIMYFMRNILEKDELGLELIRSTVNFVNTPKHIDNLKKVLASMLTDVIIDFNAEVNDFDEDFDYKTKLRDNEWVSDLNKTIVTNYEKQVHRNRVPSFKNEWEKGVNA